MTETGTFTLSLDDMVLGHYQGRLTEQNSGGTRSSTLVLSDNKFPSGLGDDDRFYDVEGPSGKQGKFMCTNRNGNLATLVSSGPYAIPQ